MKAIHDMPFSARLLEGGQRAEFRLWSPTTTQAAVVLQPGESERIATASQDEPGWHHAQTEARAGERYLWLLDQDRRTPDPASRFNPDGTTAPSMLVDALEFEWDNEWRGRPWHESAIYEMHLGCFTSAGTLAAAELQLHSLAQLGITALQLMPMAAWPGRFGWGYEPTLPFAPHAAYGSPQDAKHFIQAAHRLRMMVFMDVPGCPPDGDDMAREQFMHQALYWAQEFRADGLRLGRVPDTLFAEVARRVAAALPGRHVHVMRDDQRNLGFRDAMHTLLTDDSEVSDDHALEQLAGGMTDTGLTQRIQFLHDHECLGQRPFGERLTSLANLQALRVATGVCLLGVSPPLLFMGDEFASVTPFMRFEDVPPADREAARRQWLAPLQATPRYAEAAARGELPDPFSEATFRRCKLDRASAHSAAHREWRRWFNEVLALRQRELVPHLGRLRDDGHSWWRIGPRAFGLRWAFDDGRVFELVANLGRLAVRIDRRQAPPPLARPSLVYSVGEVIDDSVGAHAAAWHWGFA